MKSTRLITLALLAPLALSACSDNAADEAAADGSVPFDGSAPVDTGEVGSSRVDLQACKLEYSIVSPK